MNLKVKLSCRSDNYEKSYDAVLCDGNIIVDDNNKIPSHPGNWITFTSYYSPGYDKHSKGNVNTRFKYYFNGKEYHIFAYLNWFKRQLLSIIERKSLFHKHPIASVALIISTTFAIINLPGVFQNNRRALLDYNRYLKSQEHQTQILKEQVDIIQGQYKILEEILLNQTKIRAKPQDTVVLKNKKDRK